MGIGDNFDTSPSGLINQKTGRSSGDHVTNIFLPEYNGGHPCNIGCGCNEKCDPSINSTFGCLLPEELVITITQESAGGNRENDRVKIGKYEIYLHYFAHLMFTAAIIIIRIHNSYSHMN